MKYMGNKALAYGVALLIYEVVCLLANVYIVFKKCHPKSRNNELSAMKGLGGFFWYSFKISMTGWLLYVFLDCMTVMLKKVGDDAQLATYSIFYNITLVICSLIGGFYVYARNILNYFLGQGRHEDAKALFKRFFWIYLGFNLLMMVIISLGLYLVCFFGLIEDKDLDYWLKVSSPFVFGIGMCIL